MKIKGKAISLRHPTSVDLIALHQWENDPDIWQFGDYSGPFSKEEIQNFINQGQNIYEQYQERLMIVSNENNKAIGCIDLYDFDPVHRRAGIGILIYSKENRKKGLATEALNLIIKYTTNNVKLKQLYCAIEEENIISLKFFKKIGFEKIGLKKAWRFHKGRWYNEYLMQMILN